MISIITVAYNAAATIEQTLESVVSQSHDEIEYIVVDGGSKDGTVELIESHADRLAYWVSEPDQGIANAMNKGLEKAKGSHVLYLNADDYLTDPRAIERIHRRLDEPIVGGPIIKLNKYGEERIASPRGFNWWFNLKCGLYHQGTFCSRQTLLALGGFDTRYRLEMDYDLFLRAYRRRVPIKVIEEPFSVMRDGGVSTRNDRGTLTERFREEKSIHLRNCPNRLMKYMYVLYWQLYPSYKLVSAGMLNRGVDA